MLEKRRSGRVSTKTSIEDEIAHLHGLDLKCRRANRRQRRSQVADQAGL
jgi:hypothetical protein